MLEASMFSPEARALIAFMTVAALALPVSMWWLDRR
jgi:hypothetical protein